MYRGEIHNRRATSATRLRPLSFSPGGAYSSVPASPVDDVRCDGKDVLLAIFQHNNTSAERARVSMYELTNDDPAKNKKHDE